MFPLALKRANERKEKIMVKRVLKYAAVLFVLFSLVFMNSLSAASYYEGKKITLIVGYTPGGGYDILARLYAKHLPKHIPGRPMVLVENMAGADSIIAANQVYNLAKPDGLTICAFNRGLPFAQLLKTEGVRFDLRKFSWIGSVSTEAIVLALRSDLPFKSVDDILKAKEPINLGATGPASSGSQFPVLLKEFAGMNFRIITYPAGPDSLLAIERKEVEGRAGSYTSQKVPIERGLLRALIRGRVKESGIENLPVDEDLAKTPRGKTLMAMRSAPDRIGRPYVAPPKTPPEVMAILRDAFAKATKDPELLGEAAKLKMSVEYVGPDDCLKTMDYILNQPDDVVKEFGKYIKF
jgi:tripartite-type tricarboxylate transporter receptor subunit TctC